MAFQHTAARRRLDLQLTLNLGFGFVSTHSRPKAAGLGIITKLRGDTRFNTQPPEGGWFFALLNKMHPILFQHTAARRRLAVDMIDDVANKTVSTHSRPKAAGYYLHPKFLFLLQFQHTAARRRLESVMEHENVY